MKTPRWLLNLVIALINIVRPIIALFIFREFFYFRVVNIACLYATYLLLDSLEGGIVFAKREIWTASKKITHHINNSLFTFAVVSGVLMHMPIFAFLSQLGISTNEMQTVKWWLVLSLIVFAFVAAISYSTRMAWGNIQQLLIRLSFLLYCFYHMWPRRAILIPFLVFASACLIGIEVSKYGWSIKELRKKDVRFRRKKQPPPI